MHKTGFEPVKPLRTNVLQTLFFNRLNTCAKVLELIDFTT